MTGFGRRVNSKRKNAVAVVDTSGGSTTIDSVGSLEVAALSQLSNLTPQELNSLGLEYFETSLTPTEQHEFESIVSEMLAGPGETSDIAATVGDSEISPAPAETSLISAEAQNAETNAGAADIQGTLDVAVDQLETNLVPQDIAGNLNIGQDENNTLPVEVNTMDVAAQNSEAAAVQTETSISDISAQNIESNSLPAETFSSDISATNNEPNEVPVEINLMDVAAGSSETADAAADVPLSEISALNSEANGLPTETLQSDITYTAPETNSTPTETESLDASVSSAETNVAPAESQNLSISGYGETTAVQTEARSSAIRVGSTSSVSATQAGSNSWTNPTNVNGLENVTIASLTGPSGVTAARQTATLIGTYASLGTMAGESRPTSVSVTFHNVSLSGATLTTNSVELAVSTNGGSSYSTLTTITDNATVDLDYTATISLDPANLSNFKFRVTASVIGSATANSVASIDAVVVSFTVTG